MPVIGIFNLGFAVLGLTALVINITGYLSLPQSFLQEYGSFVGNRVWLMALFSAVILPPLAFTGIQLLRKRRSVLLACQLIFLIEIVFFVLILATWRFPFSVVSLLGCVASGLMNLGFALQIITAYPLIGLMAIRWLGGRARREGIQLTYGAEK
jgi:hypothetical protein